jgi:hypothetical protein
MKLKIIPCFRPLRQQNFYCIVRLTVVVRFFNRQASSLLVHRVCHQESTHTHKLTLETEKILDRTSGIDGIDWVACKVHDASAAASALLARFVTDTDTLAGFALDAFADFGVDGVRCGDGAIGNAASKSSSSSTTTTLSGVGALPTLMSTDGECSDDARGFFGGNAGAPAA